jgi:hypothetical protein
MRQASRLLSDKPMKGLSDTLPATHLALSTIIVMLHQLLVFVNSGWDCRLSTQGRVTYKSPGIPGRPKAQTPQERALSDSIGSGRADKQPGGRVLAGKDLHSKGPEERGGKALALSGLYWILGR